MAIPAEFFAVFTEAFFKRFKQLNKRQPGRYKKLAGYCKMNLLVQRVDWIVTYIAELNEFDWCSMGNVTSRSIHQKSLEEAVKMCNAVYAIAVDAKGVEEALQIYRS